MKGTISLNLEAILRDDQGRRLLRQSLLSGKDGEIRVGRTKYRVSTKSKSSTSLVGEKDGDMGVGRNTSHVSTESKSSIRTRPFVRSTSQRDISSSKKPAE